MSFDVVKRYYGKLKTENIKQLMAEDFIGLAISAVIILLGDKIANKFFDGELLDVFIGLLVLAGIVIFFIGPLFLFKTSRTQIIATHLHELHQKNERRKDESSITKAQLTVVDAEIELIRLRQEEILEKNRRLWISKEITESQDILKGKIDLESDALNRESAETEFHTIMEGFNSMKSDFLSLIERLDFKKDEIENGKKVVTLINQEKKSKESKALTDLVNPDLNDLLKDINSDIDKPKTTKVKPKPKEPDLDKIID